MKDKNRKTAILVSLMATLTTGGCYFFVSDKFLMPFLIFTAITLLGMVIPQKF